MKKAELTLAQIRELTHTAEKDILAIVKRLESQTTLTISSIEAFQSSGWTTEIGVSLDYES